MLELDELWSFVGRRKHQRWVWLAQCRRTRQVWPTALADPEGAAGGRGRRTCRLLWRRVPPGYKGGLLYTDFWRAYAKVLPAARHRPSGKRAAPARRQASGTGPAARGAARPATSPQ